MFVRWMNLADQRGGSDLTHTGSLLNSVFGLKKTDEISTV